jgi:hypothetical protein
MHLDGPAGHGRIVLDRVRILRAVEFVTVDGRDSPPGCEAEQGIEII